MSQKHITQKIISSGLLFAAFVVGLLIATAKSSAQYTTTNVTLCQAQCAPPSHQSAVCPNVCNNVPAGASCGCDCSTDNVQGTGECYSQCTYDGVPSSDECGPD